MATNGAANGVATANGHSTHNIAPKIVLYTNHRCPYAHRAHIALEQLNLPFEEVIIDLDTPRPQWYLDINPRGLVPSIKYSVSGIFDEPEIITESAIVVQFLADSFPSAFLPASKESPFAPLQRARINFFVDTWNTKVASLQYPTMKATGAEKDQKLSEWIAAVKKEIEPLLADAAPFFGGSKELTFAEAISAPFLIRWYSFANDGELLPKSFVEELNYLPNFSKWANAVVKHKSVLTIYDEQAVVQGTKDRLKKMAEKAK
ncbi:thioredoxin-like protein [Teratosphaeria nubilosa]|uniref:Thioredoxin-like protein n=1 Tax=Teratosphaeria nubilosa TaxID=161662 RepID=A0A6G1LLD4_9PEZI|nr:thioredoxin-like protein [Teratosphaeria nubilosa]